MGAELEHGSQPPDLSVELKISLASVGSSSRMIGRADGLQKSGRMVYTFSLPVIFPVFRSIRPRIVL